MSRASICACAPQARKESGLGLNTDGSAWAATDLAAQGSDEGMSPAGAGVDVDGPASCCTATFFFSALDLPTTSGRPICACGTDCAVKRTAAWACECAMHWSKARSSAWHARTGREHDLHGVGCTATASAAALGHSKRPSLAPTTRTSLHFTGMVHAWVRHTVLKCDVFKTLFPKTAFFRDEDTHNSFFLSLATLVYGMAA